jgi:hypothetical protein
MIRDGGTFRRGEKEDATTTLRVNTRSEKRMTGCRYDPPDDRFRYVREDRELIFLWL